MVEIKINEDVQVQIDVDQWPDYPILIQTPGPCALTFEEFAAIAKVVAEHLESAAERAPRPGGLGEWTLSKIRGGE